MSTPVVKSPEAEKAKKPDVQKLIDQAVGAVDGLKSQVKALEDSVLGVVSELNRYRSISIDEVKEFLKEPWLVLPKSKEEWWVIIPRWVGLSVGWLERSTPTYNLYVVNRFSAWFGAIPEELRDKLNIPPSFDATVEDGRLKAKPEIAEKFTKHLWGQTGENEFRIRQGHEFDLIAQIIDAGTLPFKPRAVDPADLRDVPLQGVLQKLRDYQEHAWQEFLKYGALGVYWPFGQGKTVFGVYAIARLKGRKLIVVPTVMLKEQWEERLSKWLSLGLRQDVEVVTYHAWERVQKEEYLLTIYDEAHRLPANSFSRLASVRTKYRIGLSATPYREDQRSIAHNEPVLVRRSGRVEMRMVGELIDSYLVDGDDIVDVKDLEVLSQDGCKCVWKKVSQASRHGVPSDGLIKVSIAGGREVTVTRNHSLITIKEDFSVGPCKADSLKKGDILLVPAKMPVIAGNGDGELARMLGWYIAEGSCVASKDGYAVSFSLGPSEMKEAQQLVQDLGHFGLPGKIVLQKARSEVRVTSGRKCAYEFFSRYGFARKTAHTKRVPWEVFNFGKENISTFLDAYHAGDAGVTVNPDLASDISYLYSMDARFATIHRSLSEGECRFPNGRVLTQSCQRYVATPAVASNRTPFKYLPREYLNGFLPILTRRRKAERAGGVSSFGIKSFSQMIGEEAELRLNLLLWASELNQFTVKMVAERFSLRRRSAEAWLRYVLGRRVITPVSRGHKWLGEARWVCTDLGREVVERYRRMKSLFQGDFYFGRVKSIKPAEYSYPHVYDFHVPGSESFVAGTGGVLCHNSAYIIALTGFPVGVDWANFIRTGRIKPPHVEVRIVSSWERKLKIAEAEVKDLKGMAIVFCDGISKGAEIAKRLDCPHIHGETQNRLETLSKAPVAVVSRVGDEGLSLPNLRKIIEVDFHGGSRRQEAQRVGRLLHAEGIGTHIVLMTQDEFDRFEGRFMALEEKGFRIQVKTV